MPTNPTNSQTSIKDHPTLRVGLLILWTVIVAYTAVVLGMGLWPSVSFLWGLSLMQTILNIPTLMQVALDFGVDILILFGFSAIAILLVVRRSDDWFAIFTSLFLITFGARLTNVVNILAVTPGSEALAGALLAMGDVGILLFLMLFPDGKLTPRWLKFAIPVVTLVIFGIYIVPGAPFFWRRMGDNLYLIVSSAFYISGFFIFIHRYFSHASLAQKQQIRWVFMGTSGPFFWYLIFRTSLIFIPALSESTIVGAGFQVVAHIMSLFMFLLLPLSIGISIVRSKLFDIDLLINRSLVYGFLTVGLIVAFAGMLGAVSLIFKTFHQGDQSLLVATVFSVSAGALFQPARKRLQRFVDRVFYHIQIDYDKTPAEAPARGTEFYTDKTTTLSSYRNLKLIGRGGMAEVYRATSPTTSKPVAIKVLPATLAADDHFRTRFLREAKMVSALHHPNIVRVIDYGDENGAYFIVMEYLTGPDLSNLLKDQKTIGIADAITILRDVAAALDYAHQSGLVHRDIKPSNVMMDTSSGTSRAVLTDFGIAKITNAHTRITVTGVLGTFDYIAPEQIQASAEVDSSADLYALGVMTYQMLTGHLPFERPNTGALLLAHISAPPPDARELVPEIPRHAAYAIQRAMAKKPKDRHATAVAFVNALESD